MSIGQAAAPDGLVPEPGDLERIDADPVRCLDPIASAAMVDEIEAARKDGDNPHIWYDPKTMLAYAAVLTEKLAAADPAHAAAFEAMNGVWDVAGPAPRDLRGRLPGTEERISRRAVVAGVFVTAGIGGTFAMTQMAAANIYRTEVGEQKLKFVLTEGRNRQIRRMCELVDLRVVDLFRVRIGPLKLASLPEGRWRALTGEERAALLNYSAHPGERRDPASTPKG